MLLTSLTVDPFLGTLSRESASFGTMSEPIMNKLSRVRRIILSSLVRVNASSLGHTFSFSRAGFCNQYQGFLTPAPCSRRSPPSRAGCVGVLSHRVSNEKYLPHGDCLKTLVGQPSLLRAK